jgi:hypothetical protein
MGKSNKLFFSKYYNSAKRVRGAERGREEEKE